MFEYAVGFWLLKSCECMLGNILCAPGCFSVIRALVLSDDLVMKKFYATSDKAHHFLQRDQGSGTHIFSIYANCNNVCIKVRTAGCVLY